MLAIFALFERGGGAVGASRGIYGTTAGAAYGRQAKSGCFGGLVTPDNKTSADL